MTPKVCSGRHGARTRACCVETPSKMVGRTPWSAAGPLAGFFRRPTKVDEGVGCVSSFRCAPRRMLTVQKALWGRMESCGRLTIGLARGVVFCRQRRSRQGPSIAHLDTCSTGIGTRKLLSDVSPVTHVHKGMPPYLIIVGTGDQTVGFRQSREMCDKMKQAGAQCEIYALKDAPHWLVKWENHPEWAGYKQKVPDWLKQQMR